VGRHPTRENPALQRRFWFLKHPAAGPDLKADGEKGGVLVIQARDEPLLPPWRITIIKARLRDGRKAKEGRPTMIRKLLRISRLTVGPPAGRALFGRGRKFSGSMGLPLRQKRDVCRFRGNASFGARAPCHELFVGPRSGTSGGGSFRGVVAVASARWLILPPVCSRGGGRGPVLVTSTDSDKPQRAPTSGAGAPEDPQESTRPPDPPSAGLKQRWASPALDRSGSRQVDELHHRHDRGRTGAGRVAPSSAPWSGFLVRWRTTRFGRPYGGADRPIGRRLLRRAGPVVAGTRGAGPG